MKAVVIVLAILYGPALTWLAFDMARDVFRRPGANFDAATFVDIIARSLS